MSKQPRVTAVVVTWNRKELLREALWALKLQTTLIDRIVVVDNASDDGTAELLRDEFGGLDVVTMAHNTGGAGGFTIGLAARARGRAATPIWMMDDDTVPEPRCAGGACSTSATTYAGGPLALVASKVVWTDGRDHPMNTPRHQARGRGRASWPRPRRSAACRSGRRRSCRCSSMPRWCASAGCRWPTTSCGTTTSSSPPA